MENGERINDEISKFLLFFYFIDRFFIQVVGLVVVQFMQWCYERNFEIYM